MPDNEEHQQLLMELFELEKENTTLDDYLMQHSIEKYLLLIVE
jgi:hypothetical protein